MLLVVILQDTDIKWFAFLGFVGDGVFGGLYWKKLYFCNRNRETEGSAQAGCPKGTETNHRIINFKTNLL